QLLSLHSDFFSNLFYGQFIERNQEVKEIKDISGAEFVSFLQSLHSRRFEFNSVRSALDTLAFADRFLMPRITKEVLPYLKRNSLSEDLLEYALTVVDGVPNNKEVLTWILTHYPSKSKVLEVVHDKLSDDSISKESALVCVKTSLKRLRELEDKEKPGYMDMMLRVASSPYHYAGLHLLYFDASRKRVVKEEFTFICIYRGYGGGMEKPTVNFWTIVPAEYTTVTINGVTYNRNEDVPVDGTGTVRNVVKAKAYLANA
ncbi:hypothetical protein PFISCL1PPCAC_25525, partial [Pristionchus fissidentatus]